MTEDTETYYRRRWKEELDAADRAADPAAAKVHRSLATRYAVLSGEPQVRAVDGEGAFDMQRASSARAR